jgi:zinc and cadmium transporter
MFNAQIPILTWIISASLLGGALSVMCAGFVALNARTQWIPMLISYAIGAMLGAVFLEILPHAFHEASSVENMAATVLFGILLFFVLEKLVLWRHCHGEHCEAHAMHTEDDCPAHEGQHHADAQTTKFKAVTDKAPSIAKSHSHGHHHDSGRSGMMIMVGDTFHNFVDGILIAAAFMIDIRLGAVTAMAIIAHEIPQEVGDFLILLHSGYSKKQALLFNLFSSLATVVGGVLAYFALQTVQNWIATILGLAAASMLYVAVADLIPGLHKRTELKATIAQVGLIGLGIGSIWLTKFFLE